MQFSCSWVCFLVLSFLNRGFPLPLAPSPGLGPRSGSCPGRVPGPGPGRDPGLGPGLGLSPGPGPGPGLRLGPPVFGLGPGPGHGPGVGRPYKTYNAKNDTKPFSKHYTTLYAKHPMQNPVSKTFKIGTKSIRNLYNTPHKTLHNTL